MRHQKVTNWIHKGDCPFWLTGSPGLGKTFLAVQIVATLKTHLRHPHIPVLYNLCSSRQNNTLNTILCVAMHQLLTSQPELAEQVREDDKSSCEIEGSQAQKHVDTLWNLFSTIIETSNLKQVYMIIDGLDECSLDTQVALLDLLESRPSKLRVLITSQPLEELRMRLSKRNPKKQWEGFDLDGEDEKINVDIDNLIHTEVERIAKLRNYLPQTKDKVSNFLKERKTGIFLPVCLVLGTLEHTQVRDVDFILQSTSEHIDTLDTLYQKLLSRIPTDVLSRPSQILQYAAYAYRALTVAELGVACMYDEERSPVTGLCDRHIMPYSSLRSDLKILGPLLRIRGTDDSVQFIHSSARNFLIHVSQSSKALLERLVVGEEVAHYEIAVQCLNHLIATSAEPFPHQWEDNYASKMLSVYANNPFYQYAMDNWDLHLRKAWNLLPPLDKRRETLTQKVEIVMGLFQLKRRHPFAELLSVRRNRYIFASPIENVAPVEFYIWLGMNGIAEKKLSQLREEIALDDSSRSHHISSILQTSAIAGNLTMFQHLLECYNIQTLADAHWSGLVPLAVTSGNIELLRLILKYRGDASPQSMAKAAIVAVFSNQTSMLDVFFEDWNLVAARDRFGMNMLHWIVALAPNNADGKMILTLIILVKARCGYSLNEPDASGNTVLHIACLGTRNTSDIDFIRGLVQAGATPGVRNYLGELPIHFAARKAIPASVEYLIAQTHAEDLRVHADGALIPYRSGNSLQGFHSNGNLSPLHWAMQRCYETWILDDFSVVKQLLDVGFSLTSSSRWGRTPLSIALENPIMAHVLSLVYFRLDGADQFHISTGSTLNCLATTKVIGEIWRGLELEERFNFLPGIAVIGQLNHNLASLMQAILILFIFPSDLLQSLGIGLELDDAVRDRALDMVSDGSVLNSENADVQSYRLWNFFQHWSQVHDHFGQIDRARNPLFQDLRKAYMVKHCKDNRRNVSSTSTSGIEATSSSNIPVDIVNCNSLKLSFIRRIDRGIMTRIWIQFVYDICCGSVDLWELDDLLSLCHVIIKPLTSNLQFKESAEQEAESGVLHQKFQPEELKSFRDEVKTGTQTQIDCAIHSESSQRECLEISSTEHMQNRNRPSAVRAEVQKENMDEVQGPTYEAGNVGMDVLLKCAISPGLGLGSDSMLSSPDEDRARVLREKKAKTVAQESSNMDIPVADANGVLASDCPSDLETGAFSGENDKSSEDEENGLHIANFGLEKLVLRLLLEE